MSRPITAIPDVPFPTAADPGPQDFTPAPPLAALPVVSPSRTTPETDPLERAGDAVCRDALHDPLDYVLRHDTNQHGE